MARSGSGRAGKGEIAQEGLRVAWDDGGLEIRATGERAVTLKLPWSLVHDLARQAGAIPEGRVMAALRILDLDAGASADDVREAHRDLAKVWRPQRFGKNARLRARAQRMLGRIREAYDILKEPRPSDSAARPAPEEADRPAAPPAPVLRSVPTGDDTLVGPRPLSEIRLPESALALLLDDAARSFFPIRSKSVLVGRYDPVTGALPEVDLTQIDVNRSVSRRHARIVLDGGGFLLSEEEGARNGTFLNGQRIAPGKTVPLQSGDRIGFGAIVLVFKAPGTADRKSA